MLRQKTRKAVATVKVKETNPIIVDANERGDVVV